MSDKTWYATSIQGSNLIAYYTDPEEAKKHGLRCEEVEIRPVHQEPCEWENEPVWSDNPDPAGMFPGEKLMLRSEHCIEIGCKFCPMCGRKLVN